MMTMLTINDRFNKLATAPAATLVKVDAILQGHDFQPSATDPDVRTCTLSEAARRLSVSRPTIYRLIKAGHIRTISVNSTPRVVMRSLFDYVDLYNSHADIKSNESFT